MRLLSRVPPCPCLPEHRSPLPPTALSLPVLIGLPGLSELHLLAVLPLRPSPSGVLHALINL